MDHDQVLGVIERIYGEATAGTDMAGLLVEIAEVCRADVA